MNSMEENDLHSSNPLNPSLTTQHPNDLPQQQDLEIEYVNLYENAPNPCPETDLADYDDNSSNSAGAEQKGDEPG
jgi:hypothetical protein